MSTIVTDLSQRDIRQRDLISPIKLKELNCIIIGTGAIGKQVAIQLSTIGVQH